MTNFKGVQVIKNNAKVIGYIQESHDYNLFRTHPLNREISQQHVEELKEDMKAINMLMPILINKEGYIIDGNHRFTAWKELGYPIWFYVVDDYGVLEMQKANLLQENWNHENYLKFYIDNDKQEYIKFKYIKEKYKINFADLLCIIGTLSDLPIGERELSIIFDKGDLRISCMDKVLTFLNELSMFDQYTNFNRHTSFIRAFLSLYNTEFYDSEYMQHRVDITTYKLIQFGKKMNISEYKKFLAEEIYSSNRKCNVAYFDKTDEFYVIRKKKSNTI